MCPRNAKIEHHNSILDRFISQPTSTTISYMQLISFQHTCAIRISNFFIIISTSYQREVKPWYWQTRRNNNQPCYWQTNMCSIGLYTQLTSFLSPFTNTLLRQAPALAIKRNHQLQIKEVHSNSSKLSKIPLMQVN